VNYYPARNKNKEITGLHARPQYKGHKCLSEDNPEIITFLTKDKEKDADEAKIQTEIRQMAIENLKARGELPEDYGAVGITK